jgi:hypothetical protein
MTPRDAAGAFVVQLRPRSEGDTDGFEGRIEHIASGDTAQFSSAQELLERLAHLWKAARGARREIGDGGQ